MELTHINALTSSVVHLLSNSCPRLAHRVIYVEAGDENAVLACFEEGLRYRKLGAVVAEVGHLSVAASRRSSPRKASA